MDIFLALAIILFALWGFGFTLHLLGGFIHVFIFAAIVVGAIYVYRKTKGTR